MNRSDAIDKLAAALVAAQAEVENPKMDSKGGPPKNNRYASLGAVRAAVLPVFLAHGLAVVQVPGTGTGGPTVTTLLVHASGQWLECDPLTIPAAKQDAQSYGSALTYGRRYSLQAVAGVVSEEDDDGEAASTPPRQKQQAQPATSGRPATDSAPPATNGSPKPLPQRILDVEARLVAAGLCQAGELVAHVGEPLPAPAAVGAACRAFELDRLLRRKGETFSRLATWLRVPLGTREADLTKDQQTAGIERLRTLPDNPG